MNPSGPCVFLGLEVGNTFLILNYLEARQQNVCNVMQFHGGTLLSFDFSLNLLKSLLAWHYAAYLFLLA